MTLAPSIQVDPSGKKQREDDFTPSFALELKGGVGRGGVQVVTKVIGL